MGDRESYSVSLLVLRLSSAHLTIKIADLDALTLNLMLQIRRLVSQVVQICRIDLQVLADLIRLDL